jgi:hypothetical protein
MKLKKLKLLFPVLISVVITIGLSVAIQSLFAWTTPTAAPPSDNVAAPLNSGPSWQTKEGALWINIDGINPYGLIVENGNVGIGTTNPTSELHIASERVNTSTGLKIDVAENTDWNSNPGVYGKRARGTLTGLLPVLNGDALFENYGYGYDGAQYREAGGMFLRVDGTPGINDMPSRWEFYTVPDGSDVHQIRMVIKNDGRVGIGTTDPKTKLDVNGLIKLYNAGSGGTCDANTLGAIFYDTDGTYGDVKICRKNGLGGYEFKGLAWQ